MIFTHIEGNQRESKSFKRLRLLIAALVACPLWVQPTWALDDMSLEPSRIAPKEKQGELEDKLTGPGGIEFQLIPAGEFTMGNNAGYSKPPRRVKISRPFYISKTEITQGQFAALSEESSQQGSNPNLPKTHINFPQARDFAESYKLNGLACRLPLEAEWEYACAKSAESSISPEEAWFDQQSHQPEPVGQLKQNEFGLHDMLGNVWEWILDDAHRYQSSNEVLVDPMVYKGSEPMARAGVIRGAAYHSPLRRVSCQTRQKVDRQFVSTSFVGFRIVCKREED